jgi:hypothetical protein
MHLGTVEALKAAVRSRLGMSIVPDIAVAEQGDLIVRPLGPAVPSTLALIEHRNKTGGLALEIVRKALLELRDPDAAATKTHNAQAQTCAEQASQLTLRQTDAGFRWERLGWQRLLRHGPRRRTDPS